MSDWKHVRYICRRATSIITITRYTINYLEYVFSNSSWDTVVAPQETSLGKKTSANLTVPGVRCNTSDTSDTSDTFHDRGSNFWAQTFLSDAASQQRKQPTIASTIESFRF